MVLVLCLLLSAINYTVCGQIIALPIYPRRFSAIVHLLGPLEVQIICARSFCMLRSSPLFRWSRFAAVIDWECFCTIFWKVVLIIRPEIFFQSSNVQNSPGSVLSNYSCSLGKLCWCFWNKIWRFSSLQLIRDVGTCSDFKSTHFLFDIFVVMYLSLNEAG